MSRLRSAACVVACLFFAACKAALPPWGGSIDAAKRNADNAFAAFAFRFHNVQRDARFSHARPLMGKYALTPSKIFNDTSIWTVTNTQDNARAIYLQAGHDNSRYFFAARAAAPYPTKLGDERHFMQLRELSEDNYEWYTDVDHGIGPVRAEQVAEALGTLFTAFEGKRDAELLADMRANFSRTAQHLGQMFSLDSLRSTPLTDGTTSFALFASYRVDELRKGYPNYAAYIDKYVRPSDLHLRLTDHQGATFLDVAQSDGAFAIRLRARDGNLIPLSGAPRVMPDSLTLIVDASAKFKIFRVGFRGLRGDFTIERGEHERAWMMRFRQEPDWHFPLAVDHLIKAPLRRPFEGRGSELRLAVRDDLGNQSMSVRQVRTAVRESAIMRWLGGLGATAFGEYEGRTEAEENRFLQELFGALRLDFARLGS